MKSVTEQVIVAVALVLSLTAVGLAAYSPPPSWSPMTMLNVNFDTATHAISVVDQPATPTMELAVDTYKDPSVTTGPTAYGRCNLSATTFGTFDGTKPWAVLQNKAFSRRLGWNPADIYLKPNIEAAYGPDASIWIELVSQSAGLEAYKAVGKYGVNSAGTLDANYVPVIDPNAHGYDPIFGTAGSSSKWKWDYLMDHNVYAVSAAYLTGLPKTFTATYRVYVGDSSGADLDAGHATQETWTWQASVPEPATLSLLVAGAFAFVRRRAAQ